MNLNYGPYKKFKTSPLGMKGGDANGYIKFAASIEKYLNGGMSISFIMASRMASLNGLLKGTDISSFDEFPLFSKIHTIDYGNTFQNCKELESITLPDGVVYIHPLAFQGCEKLVSVKNAGKFGIGSIAITSHPNSELFRIY